MSWKHEARNSIHRCSAGAGGCAFPVHAAVDAPRHLLQRNGRSRIPAERGWPSSVALLSPAGCALDSSGDWAGMDSGACSSRIRRHPAGMAHGSGHWLQLLAEVSRSSRASMARAHPELRETSLSPDSDEDSIGFWVVLPPFLAIAATALYLHAHWNQIPAQFPSALGSQWTAESLGQPRPVRRLRTAVDGHRHERALPGICLDAADDVAQGRHAFMSPSACCRCCCIR